MNTAINLLRHESWDEIQYQFKELVDLYESWKTVVRDHEANDEPDDHSLSERSYEDEDWGEYFPDDDEEDVENALIASHYIERIIEQINTAIENRLSEQIQYLFEEAEYYCHFLDIDFDSNRDSVSNALSVIKIASADLLYIPPLAPSIIVPELIVPVQKHLVSLVKNNPASLFSITPRQFEELIAELFHDFGFDVELTQATRDEGRDIIAIFEKANIKSKYLIECKRYQPKNKVSLSIVQRLFAVKLHEAANKAILVTTSAFTKPAVQFADNHVWDLDLKGYNDVINWVNDYNTNNPPLI